MKKIYLSKKQLLINKIEKNVDIVSIEPNEKLLNFQKEKFKKKKNIKYYSQLKI